MAKLLFIIAVLLILYPNVIGCNSLQEQLQEQRYQFYHSKSQSEKTKSMLWLGDYYIKYLHNPELSRVYIAEAGDDWEPILKEYFCYKFRESKDQNVKAFALFSLGDYYSKYVEKLAPEMIRRDLGPPLEDNSETASYIDQKQAPPGVIHMSYADDDWGADEHVMISFVFEKGKCVQISGVP